MVNDPTEQRKKTSPPDLMGVFAETSPRKSFADLNPLEQVLAFLFMSIFNADSAEADNNPEAEAENARVMGFATTQEYTAWRRSSARENWRTEHDFSNFDFNGAERVVRERITQNPSPVTGDTYNAFLDHLRRREGYKNTVYRDSEGHLTVGVGHLVRPEDNLQLGDRISDAQVQAFLEKDARGAFNAAQQQAAELGISDSNFIIALGSVNYQLGTGWRSKFSNTWQMMKDGQFAEAAAKLDRSLWARQTPVRVDDFQQALHRADGLSGPFVMAAHDIKPAPAETPAERPTPAPPVRS